MSMWRVTPTVQCSYFASYPLILAFYSLIRYIFLRADGCNSLNVWWKPRLIAFKSLWSERVSEGGGEGGRDAQIPPPPLHPTQSPENLREGGDPQLRHAYSTDASHSDTIPAAAGRFFNPGPRISTDACFFTSSGRGSAKEKTDIMD